MGRVVHFEINADEPEKSIKFYEDVFGWKFKKWEGPMDYWLITTGDEKKPGIDGGLMKREDPGATIYDTIDVSSVDEFIKKIEANGGTITQPKTAVPGVGWMAYFKDIDGNVFGIMEDDETAK
jgi:predicted enzyme related to lactoylglutathione lyase